MFAGLKELWSGASAEVKNFVREVFAIGVAHRAMGGGNSTEAGSPATARPQGRAEVTAGWLFKLLGGGFFNTDEAALANALKGLSEAENVMLAERLAQLDPTAKDKANNACAQHVRDVICLLPSEERPAFIAMIARLPEDEWKRFAEATGIGTEPMLAWARRMVGEKFPEAKKRIADADDTAAQKIQDATSALDGLTAATTAKRQALQAKIRQREARTTFWRRVLMLFGFSPIKL